MPGAALRTFPVPTLGAHAHEGTAYRSRSRSRARDRELVLQSSDRAVVCGYSVTELEGGVRLAGKEQN